MRLDPKEPFQFRSDAHAIAIMLRDELMAARDRAAGGQSMAP
jgi:hypothetical protein